MKPSWDYSKFSNQRTADAMNYYNQAVNDTRKENIKDEDDWGVFSLLSKMVVFLNGETDFYETIIKYKEDLLQLRENINELNGEVQWATDGELLTIVNHILEDCPKDVIIKPIDYAINF